MRVRFISQPEIQTIRTKLNEQNRNKDNYKTKHDTEREKLALFGGRAASPK